MRVLITRNPDFSVNSNKMQLAYSGTHDSTERFNCGNIIFLATYELLRVGVAQFIGSLAVMLKKHIKVWNLVLCLVD